MDAFKAWVCSSECQIPAGAGWDDLNVKLAEAAWLAAIASERDLLAAKLTQAEYLIGAFERGADASDYFREIAEFRA